jgi:hypothetical protein
VGLAPAFLRDSLLAPPEARPLAASRAKHSVVRRSGAMQVDRTAGRGAEGVRCLLLLDGGGGSSFPEGGPARTRAAPPPHASFVRRTSKEAGTQARMKVTPPPVARPVLVADRGVLPEAAWERDARAAAAAPGEDPALDASARAVAAVQPEHASADARCPETPWRATRLRWPTVTRVHLPRQVGGACLLYRYELPTRAAALAPHGRRLVLELAYRRADAPWLARRRAD